MRRAPLLAIAASVAIAAPLLVVLASTTNRAGEPEAEVEMTERELRLVPLGEGHRWAVLRLDWNRDLQWDRKEPGWLDKAKLAGLGFVLSALAVWLGVRSAWPEVTNVAGGAFVLYLYVKLYDWWWAFLPRWVFFLLLGLVAVGFLLLLRRLHGLARRSPA